MAFSKPSGSPAQEIAQYSANVGWTIQANVNPNDPNTGTAGPQGAFQTYASGVLGSDPYQATEAPKKLPKAIVKKARRSK